MADMYRFKNSSRVNYPSLGFHEVHQVQLASTKVKKITAQLSAQEKSLMPINELTEPSIIRLVSDAVATSKALTYGKRYCTFYVAANENGATDSNGHPRFEVVDVNDYKVRFVDWAKRVNPREISAGTRMYIRGAYINFFRAEPQVCIDKKIACAIMIDPPKGLSLQLDSCSFTASKTNRDTSIRASRAHAAQEARGATATATAFSRRVPAASTLENCDMEFVSQSILYLAILKCISLCAIVVDG